MTTTTTGKTPPKPRGEGREESDRWSAVHALIWPAVLVISSLAGAAVGLHYLRRDDEPPETVLSFIFVLASIALIIVLGSATIVLKRLGLSTKKEAMALPPGSVRAIIALQLILLFFIAAVFLFNSTRAPVSHDPEKARHLQGISTDRMGSIPTEQIAEAIERKVGDTMVYDVTLYPPAGGTATSDDIAKQLVTTLGVLVTAVASFYFGSKTASRPGNGNGNGNGGDRKDGVDTERDPDGGGNSTDPKEVQRQETRHPPAASGRHGLLARLGLGGGR